MDTITKINQEQLKESLKVGMIFFDKRGERIIRIKEIFMASYREDLPKSERYRTELLEDIYKEKVERL